MSEQDRRRLLSNNQAYEQIDADDLLNRRQNFLRALVQESAQAVSRAKSYASRIVEDNIANIASGGGLSGIDSLTSNGRFRPKIVGPIEQLSTREQGNILGGVTPRNLPGVRGLFIMDEAEHRDRAEQATERDNRYTPKSTWRQSDEYTDLRSQIVGTVFPFTIRNLARLGFPNADDLEDAAAPGGNIGAKGFRESFIPYINSFNEQYTANWDGRGYIGRSEDVYMYQSTSRGFNLDFTMVAMSNYERRRIIDLEKGSDADSGRYGYKLPIDQLDPELTNALGALTFGFAGPPGAAAAVSSDIARQDVLEQPSMTKEEMWRKLKFLESCLYPSYDTDDRYARTPFLRIDFGHLWRNQLMIITSLNITYTPLVWTIGDAEILPMFANVVMGGTLIHDSSPGTLADGRFGYTTADDQFVSTRAPITPNEDN